MKNTDGFICALKADLFKLRKMKSVWIGMAVMFGLMLILYCICWIVMSIASHATNVDPVIQQETLYAFAQLCGSLLSGFSDTASISLFVAIITCLFVGKDFSNGAMRLCIARGANRTNLFFSKWLTLCILIIGYSIFAIVVCGIFTSISGYPVEFTPLHFGRLMRCFALQVLYNISTMSIVLAIAFLCRSSGASLGATIGGAIAISLIFSLITSVGALGGDSVAWVYFMPLQQSGLMGFMDKYSATELCSVLIMPIVYGAISITIGLTTFLKRDVK